MRLNQMNRRTCGIPFKLPVISAFLPEPKLTNRKNLHIFWDFDISTDWNGTKVADFFAGDT